MKKRRCMIIIAALTALATALSGCGAGAAAASPGETTPAPMTLSVATPVPAAALALKNQYGHPALMENDDDGNFYPRRAVTRRELCRALYSLLEGLPEGTEGFADDRTGTADDTAAAAVYAAGLLPAGEDGSFGPAEAVTRRELAYALQSLAGCISGDGGVRAGTLASEVITGRMSAAGTAESGDEPVLREELAVVLTCLAGREPNETALFLGECLPDDITRESYAWADIADAVTAGRIADPAPGVHRAYGWLYAVWEDGTLMTDIDYGVWTFSLDGRYTTGNEELDGYLADALEACGANDLTDREALEAAYLYVKYHFSYLVRPEDMDVLETGATGWEYDRALRFFRYGGGTCYGYAAAFGLLARALGQNAYIIAGQVNEYHGAHSFVVIPGEDGTDLIYDVELEATRQSRHPDLALFGIRNYSIYNYWYETNWSTP